MYKNAETQLVNHLKTSEPMTAYEIGQFIGGGLSRLQVGKFVRDLEEREILEVATNCNHVFRYRLKELHKQRVNRIVEHLDLVEPRDFDYLVEHTGMERKMIMRIMGELKRRNRVICRHKLQGRRYFILNIIRPFGCESELTEQFNALLYGYRKDRDLMPARVMFEHEKLNNMEPEPEQ